MVSIDARSLIYELRSIRMAIRDHNMHLDASLASWAAQDQLDHLIGVIEDVSQLFEAPDGPAEEARVGEGFPRNSERPWRSPSVFSPAED